mgnify:FL=1|tara:strand:- start:199 stop:483 length:285 start_codon:yes stop_codon:yes gene_type:complete
METRIYYFSAEWCGPCKQFKPLMESLEKKGYPIYFQDVDTDPILAESYQIKSVPSIKIVQDNNVVESMVGVQDPVSLVQKFEMYAPLQTDEDES